MMVGAVSCQETPMRGEASEDCSSMIEWHNWQILWRNCLFRPTEGVCFRSKKARRWKTVVF